MVLLHDATIKYWTVIDDEVPKSEWKDQRHVEQITNTTIAMERKRVQNETKPIIFLFVDKIGNQKEWKVFCCQNNNNPQSSIKTSIW